MKGSNIATIVLISIITTIAAAIMVNSLLGDPNDEFVTVDYMDVISEDVAQPDSEVFNNKAVNPTVEVYVGNCATGEKWDEEEQRCVEEQTETEDDENADADGEETDQETDVTGE